jgi:predicted permease
MIGSSLREFFLRCRAFFRPATRRNTKAHLDEEFEFHIEMSAQLIQARDQVSVEEAHRRAVVEFGGVERNREETYRQRPGWLAETMLQDIRYALRGFRRNPAFAVTVIATLALGIGATTAVFSVVDRILFRSLPYAEDDRLVSMGLVQPLEKQEFMLGGFFYEWQQNQKPFTAVTFEQGTGDCNLTDVNPVHLQCARVAQNFLPTLGITPILGRSFLPEEDLPHGPRVALISDALWQSRYNRDPKILNQAMSLDGHTVRIVGVLPASFEMPRLQAADIVVPAQMDVQAQHTVNSGIGFPMWAFARLKPGVSIAEAQAAMQPLYLHTQQWIPAEFRNEFRLQIRSVRDRQMQDVYQAAWLLLGGVFAVLLIACANVASLFSARGAARERELAVRSAIGASRGRLVRQTMTEAMVLALAGAIAGCVLAEVLLRAFVSIAPTGIPFLADARLDLRIGLFALLVSILCAVFFGSLAALEKPRSSALTARSTLSPVRARMRQILVAAQIAISVVLLSGAGLFLKSFANLEHQGLGMSSQHVITVHVPLNEEKYPHGFMDFDLQAEAALRQLPGVSAVGMSNSLPPEGWHDGMRFAEIKVVGKPPAPNGSGGTVTTRSITPEYFHVLGIPMLQGEGFTEAERGSSNEFIVLNRTLAARLFPQSNAVGQNLQFGRFDPYYKADPTLFNVVGVAGDVQNEGLTNEIEPEFYTLKHNRNPGDWTSHHHFFLLQSALPASALRTMIQAQIAKLDSTAPVEIETFSETVNRLADRPRFETALLGLFALCGMVMAVIGLYGVIAYVASQRTHEIGVRVALGATRMDILRLIAGEGARIILLGSVAGLGAALLMARLVQSLLFQVAPHDPGIYVSVAGLLALVALVATLIPARRAMRVDPMEALRCE